MTNDNSIFNINNLISFCFKYKIKLIITIFLSVFVSSIVALFLMEEKFKSSAVIFPTTTNSISQALLIEDNPYKKDILEFGEEETTEQLLQIFNSDMVQDSVVKIFNLYSHYEISENDPFSRTWMNLAFEENIKFKKTPYGSIKIEVLDKNPKIAADIANKCLDLVDVAIKKIKTDRAEKAYFICDERKRSLETQMSQVNDSLNIIRNQGVFYGTAQTERLIEQYAICLANNNKRGAQLIKKELNKLSKYITEHNLLERRTHHFQSEFNRIQDVCDLIRIDFDYELTNMFIVNKAYPADKKSYPIRWLVVFLSTFSILVAFIIILRCIELYNFKKNDK
tara:strand:- start:8069 stop:9082 length:1014 start_codon:yes stop_codon:yes gene_type:complete